MLIEFKKLTNINDLDPYIIEIQKVLEGRIQADSIFQCGIHSLVLSKVMELKPIVTTKIIEKEKEQRKLEEELNQMVLEQENQKKRKKKRRKII